MIDSRRQSGRDRLRPVPGRDDRSSRRSDASAPPNRTPVPTPSTGRRNGGPLTLGGLVAFGAIAWALGIVLAINDRASQFSKASAITILLMLGCLAFLAGLAQVARRVRSTTTTHVVVESEIRDPLTGLPNKRYLTVRLEEEMARSRRDGRPLTVAVLDINSLAAVNEQYGRDCGDEVLRHVAAVAEHTKRASDAVARMSEDEFAIILSDCGDEGGRAFVQRLTERLAREPVSALLDNRPSHVWVGVCVGLAALHSEEDTAATILDRARADLASSREERDRRRQLWRSA